MLKNAPALAVRDVDTAENEPEVEVRQFEASTRGPTPRWPSAGNETERGSRRKHAVSKKQCRIANAKQYRKTRYTQQQRASGYTRNTEQVDAAGAFAVLLLNVRSEISFFCKRKMKDWSIF